MPKILIENLGKTVVGSFTTGPLLSLLQEQHIDWMHACGGKGRCTTCKAIILAGEQNLGPRTAAELRYDAKGALLPNERLACQTLVIGDIIIAVPEESKLPHLNYTS